MLDRLNLNVLLKRIVFSFFSQSKSTHKNSYILQPSLRKEYYVKNCSKKLWSKIVVKNCGQKLWSKIVVKNCGQKYVKNCGKKYVKNCGNDFFMAIK